MIKMLVFNKRKEGVSMEEYREHYETIHVPLALSFFPTVGVYRRNYFDRDATAQSGRTPEKYLDDTDFDSIAEVFFEDWEAFETFREKSAQPEVRAQIFADEEKFIDGRFMRRYIVQPDGDSPWT